jgi:hypothetical protein
MRCACLVRLRCLQFRRGTGSKGGQVCLPAEAAALEVRNQIGELTCGVVTNFTGIATFYSRCATRGFFADRDPALAAAALEGEGRFMVLNKGWRGIRRVTTWSA